MGLVGLGRSLDKGHGKVASPKGVLESHRKMIDHETQFERVKLAEFYRKLIQLSFTVRFEKAGKSITWVVKEPVVHQSFFNFVHQEGPHCVLEKFRILKLQEGVEFMRAEIRVSLFPLQLA